MYKVNIILCVILVLSACGSAGIRQRAETLDATVDEYAFALRWGRYESARAYHVKRDGSKPEIDLAGLDSIRVTGHAFSEKIVDKEVMEATIKGEFTYFNDAYGTVRKLPFTQSWWYEPQSKRWFLESDFPDFK